MAPQGAAQYGMLQSATERLPAQTGWKPSAFFLDKQYGTAGHRKVSQGVEEATPRVAIKMLHSKKHGAEVLGVSGRQSLGEERRQFQTSKRELQRGEGKRGGCK